jgi:hypothetical protein
MTKQRYNPSIIEEISGVPFILMCLAFSPLLRPWYSRWGATSAEVAMALPGDDLIAQPTIQSTRAITIRAPQAAVWPWLAQMGQGRGGLYSYERLENLVGCQMRNADEIIPALQGLKAGDGIQLDPRQPPLPVHTVERPHTLLFFANSEAAGAAAMPDGHFQQSWLFHLLPVDAAVTRLLIRTRSSYKRRPASILIWRVFTDPIGFVMERQMLRGIKRRAEGIKAR